MGAYGSDTLYFGRISFRVGCNSSLLRHVRTVARSVCALHRTQSLKALSLFNVGRVTGYSLAGLLFGAFGEFINLGPSNFCCQLDLFPVRGALLALLFLASPCYGLESIVYAKAVLRWRAVDGWQIG